MTYQPPPPPPPPPPARNYGGQPGPAFDPKSVNPLDWGILGIGAIVFIFSFFDYYSWSLGPFSVSWSAWHFGHGLFIAWFAMVIGVAAAALVALELFMPTVKLQMPNRLAALGLFAISLVLYVIAIFAHSDFGPSGGHGFSFWLSLVLVAAGLVLSLMRVQQTGQQLPGALNNLPNLGAYGPGQHGTPPAPQAQNPPPPGYQPPGAPPQQ
jgi:hypothetical protein